VIHLSKDTILIIDLNLIPTEQKFGTVEVYSGVNRQNRESENCMKISLVE